MNANINRGLNEKNSVFWDENKRKIDRIVDYKQLHEGQFQNKKNNPFLERITKNPNERATMLGVAFHIYDGAFIHITNDDTRITPTGKATSNGCINILSGDGMALAYLNNFKSYKSTLII